MSLALFVSDYPGTVADATRALLLANGAVSSTIPDMWMQFFDLQVVPDGTLQDRMRMFLLTYTGAADTGQTVNDLWALVDGPFSSSVDLALFANGENGAWYDVNDLSTMFQDAAGTTPVTGADQPVGLWLDKSGNDHHLSQASATLRPILRQIPSSTRYRMQFDGVDDYLAANSVAGMLTGDDLPFSWFTGVEYSVAIGGFRVAFAFGNSGDLIPIMPLAPNINTTPQGQTGKRNSVQKYHNFNLSAATPHSMAGASNGTTLSVWTDGTKVLDLVDIDVTSGTFNRFAVGVLSRNSLSSYYEGFVYGLTVVNRIATGAEVTDLNAAYAERLT